MTVPSEWCIASTSIQSVLVRARRNYADSGTMGRATLVAAGRGSKNYLLTCVLCSRNILIVMNNIPASNGNDAARIYNRLAVLRAERGLSRQALADAVAVNYQTIGFLER